MAATYFRVRQKKGHNVAVVALARKLVVLVWHLLVNQEPYRYATLPARRKLRALVPKTERKRAAAVPRSLEDVYEEAKLPLPATPSRGEQRAAANNRRARTRHARKVKNARQGR